MPLNSLGIIKLYSSLVKQKVKVLKWRFLQEIVILTYQQWKLLLNWFNSDYRVTKWYWWDLWKGVNTVTWRDFTGTLQLIVWYFNWNYVHLIHVYWQKSNRYTGMTNNHDYHKRMILPTPNFKTKQITYNPRDVWGINQVFVIT